MKKKFNKGTFDSELFEQMQRCIACFAINMYDLEDWQKMLLSHTALCSNVRILKDDAEETLR